MNLKRILLLAVSFSLLGASCGLTGSVFQFFPFVKKEPPGGLFFSSDYGKNWEALGRVDGVRGLKSLSQTDMREIIFDKGDRKHIYLVTRGRGVWESFDGGESFKPYLTFDVNYMIEHAGRFIIASGNKIGIYSSQDKKVRAIYVHGVPGSVITRIAVSPGGTLFAITTTGEVLKSKNRGESWSVSFRASAPLTGFYGQDSSAFIYSLSGGLWRSPDEGKTWEKISANKISSMSGNSKSIYIAAAGSALSRSSDYGNKWMDLKLITASSSANIWSLKVSQDDKDIYYAADTAFFASFDGGQTWKSQSLPAQRIPYVLEFSPDKKGLYLGFNSLR